MPLRIFRKPISIGGYLGATCMLFGAYTFDSARYIYHLSEPSDAAQSLPLQTARVDSTWIKSGNPQFRVLVYAQSHESTSGIWECEGPTTFEWTFPQDEQVYILQGKVDVEYLGNKFTLEPGQSALFFADTKAVWHVPERVRKSFTLHQPSMVVRMYRHLFGVE